MQHEEWKPVTSHVGVYEVSSLGRVRSVERVVAGSDGRQRKCPSIILKQSRTNGYFYVTLKHMGSQRCAKVHSLVAAAFCGQKPAGMECRHLNGVKSDNRACNLRWGTRKENATDSLVHGTRARGSRHGCSKLNEDCVLEIKARIRCGDSNVAIARDYSVSEASISSIKLGKKWKHVQ